jgi:phosphate transport system substrate-binding protein
MLHRFRYVRFLAAVLCLACASCAESGDDITLQGAGATLPAPLYKRWFLEFYKQHPNVRVNYQAIGSGAGIRQFTEGLVHFGASDAAMTDKEMEKVPAGVQLLPMTAGSIAVCYNIPGGPAELRLSRKLLVDILLGNIESWNDPAIAADNPKASLPDMPIVFVRRSEGSGTTFAFTNHLSAISPEWKKDPGVGKSVVWKVGIGAKGNSGVAALIQQTPGSLGYVESGYAELSHLPIAAVQNKAGKFVLPTAENSQIALATAQLPENLRVWITDPEGANAYPIITYTWILCQKKYDDPRTSQALKEVLRYGLTEGQKIAPELGYVPLPTKVVDKVLRALDNITP